MKTNEERLLASAKKYRHQNELNDSVWVWLAAPILLLAVIAIAYVRVLIGV